MSTARYRAFISVAQQGSLSAAARSLGVSPKNLWNKIQKHRIDPAEYAA